jgi:beta-glucosidase
VLALGEASFMSGEAGCRADIRLPEPQLQLIQEFKKLEKPTVAVLFNGRPLDLHGVVEHVDAVLEAWYPGTEGGAAIADLLFGDVNPTGRLSMSMPFSVGQVPVYYNHFNTGRPQPTPDNKERYLSHYLDIPNEPLFPFGFGLSYTEFTYEDLKLSGDTLTEDGLLIASVTVTNTGDRAGEELVQLYIRDIAGEVVRPVKELKGYKKIELKPGVSETVTFEIKEEMLRYHHENLEFKSDAGKFTAFVGRNSYDVTSVSFRLVK